MPAPEQLDTTIRIVTPENIAFTYQVAGPFRRLPAFVIDLALRFLFVFLIAVILMLFGALAGGWFRELIEYLGAGVVLFIFFLEWFYGGVFETYWNGQTPGKRLLGIRVLSVDGQPITGLQAMMRNILRTADIMPILPLSAIVQEEVGAVGIPTAMLGLICVASTRRFQRLGDLVCGTMVVVEDRSWLAGLQPMGNPEVIQLAEKIPAGFRVNRDISRALATYVERRKAFSIPRRNEIARKLAVPLIERFGLPPSTSQDQMVCALYYRTFIADRGQLDSVETAGILRLAGVQDEPQPEPATPTR